MDASCHDTTCKSTHIFRLNLAQSTLDELVSSLRKDQKARIRLGKHQSLHYGNKSQPFFSSHETNRSEIYLSSPSSKGNIYFTGVLSHSLEVQKAREATTATDEALANLEQSMNAFEREREFKKTPLIATIDQMRALGAGDNRTATGREAASLARMPTSKIDVEKERFFKNAANRSTSASPALLASRSPALSAITPTSATIPQNKDKIRQDALRVPFIHLLAVRPVSAKSLAQKTRSSPDDCLSLSRKFCVENRQDREKLDLRDKVYKELDVWNFPYPSQEERQEAIENSISAFDRMRLSKSDKLWQMLLSKNERGKGKVLSRLNLNPGSMTKNATPRINVQPSEEPAKDGYGTGNETPRTNGALTPSATKPDSGTQKKRPAEKNMPVKRPTSKPKNNTTLTGKVTKKTDKKADKKAAPQVDGKFKSAEFVQESDDEDTEMIDPPAPESLSTGISKPSAKAAAAKPHQKSARKSPSVSKPKEPEAESSKSSNAKSSQALKTLPAPASASRANSSSSPQKPSPLGSSPPTNASDLDNATQSSHTTHSSSSSSPLITQHSKPKVASSTTKSSSQVSASVNGNNKPSPASNPLKRKADDNAGALRGQHVGPARHTKPRPIITTEINAHINPKRRRASSPSSGSTTGSASPPLTQEILLRKLREKSQQFKRYYSKYRTLHEQLTADPDPPREDVELLERQHDRLQKMKDEIWAEHRRLGKR